MHNSRHFLALQFVPAFWFLSVSPKTHIGLPPNQKSSLDPHMPNYYIPISNFSYISKLG